MKKQIHDTILSILAEKRANGDVLPFATSIEVAHRVHLGAWQVEEIAKGIEKSNVANCLRARASLNATDNSIVQYGKDCVTNESDA